MQKQRKKPKGKAATNRRTGPTAEALQAEQKQLEKAAKGQAQANKAPLTSGVARNWASKPAQRREQVADLARRGFSQCRIAEELNVSRTTVWSDLRALSEAWQVSAVDCRRTWALEICRRLEHLCDLALNGYRRSLQDRVTVTETTDLGPIS